MGQIGEYIKMAIDNIRANRGRSILTMLGIIIGISSVITIVSLGNGMKEQVVSESNSSVFPIIISVNAEKANRMDLITMDDLMAVQSTFASRIQCAYVEEDNNDGTVETRKGKFQVSLKYTIPGFNDQYTDQDNKIFRGEYFTEDDVLNASKVAVINKAGAIELFGTSDVIGMDVEVTLNNRVQNFRIVGVRNESKDAVENSVKEKTAVGLEIPYTAAASMGQEINGFSSVTVKTQSGEKPLAVSKAVINLLQKRHMSDGEELFTRTDLGDFISGIGKILDVVTIFIALIAGISLLVGGIGVMNIMLVSVTERTREIGIRKSLGATMSSILIQFLCESAIISGMGGVIGIILGITTAKLISMIKVIGITAKISLSAVLIATLFSCGVGIIFGIYPAKKAAKLSPIDALRRV